jgi:hypothetical protein
MLQVEKLIDGMQDFAIMRRLVTDPRMRYVWRELKKHGASDNDLRYFISVAYSVAAGPLRVMTLEQRTEAANFCLTVAVVSRDAIRQDVNVRNDPQLAAALALTAAYSPAGAQLVRGIGTSLPRPLSAVQSSRGHFQLPKVA